MLIHRACAEDGVQNRTQVTGIGQLQRPEHLSADSLRRRPGTRGRDILRKGISIMPPFRENEVSDADLDALAAYLARNTPKIGAGEMTKAGVALRKPSMRGTFTLWRPRQKQWHSNGAFDP